MADDLKGDDAPYEYPFEMPSEDAVKFGDGAIEGRPPGVPSSYDEGGSTRWTPEAIAEVHALSQLGRRLGVPVRSGGGHQHRRPPDRARPRTAHQPGLSVFSPRAVSRCG